MCSGIIMKVHISCPLATLVIHKFLHESVCYPIEGIKIYRADWHDTSEFKMMVSIQDIVDAVL